MPEGDAIFRTALTHMHMNGSRHIYRSGGSWQRAESYCFTTHTARPSAPTTFSRCDAADAD